MDSGHTGHHPTRTNKIFRLQLGNVGKELVMVENSEEDKSGYKVREKRRGGRKPVVNLKSKGECGVFLRNVASPPLSYPEERSIKAELVHLTHSDFNIVSVSIIPC